MRLVLVLLLAACGANVEVGRGGGGGDDDDSSPDATEPAADASVPDAPPPDATSFLALCMQKGYQAQGTASLYRFGAGATWLDAEAGCAADVPGATHLLVLSSQTEIDLARQNPGWIGLSDQATEGVFVNVTNEPNDQRPFVNGQPDNGSGNEDCVQMKPEGLDDDQCNNTHRFVCECDGVPAAP